MSAMQQRIVHCVDELPMGLCSSDKLTGESVMTHPDWQVLVFSRYGSCQQVVTHAQFKRNICTQTAHAWGLVSGPCSFNWRGKGHDTGRMIERTD